MLPERGESEIFRPCVAGGEVKNLPKSICTRSMHLCLVVPHTVSPPPLSLASFFVCPSLDLSVVRKSCPLPAEQKRLPSPCLSFLPPSPRRTWSSSTSSWTNWRRQARPSGGEGGMEGGVHFHQPKKTQLRRCYSVWVSLSHTHTHM